MQKTGKVLSLLLSLLFVLAALLAGCGQGSGTNGTTAQSDTKPSDTTPTTQKEEKIKLTMFMTNSGLAHPDGVDPSDNPWVNIIENYANVDLDIEVPAYQDYQTKMNLLLSSGQLPDIFHSNYLNESNASADQGAFIELKKYYDQSPAIQKYITAEMMEIAKSPSGHYYRIPMSQASMPQGKAVIARWDLVKKYNNNQWPATVDEWINLMRTMHKAEPDAIVFGNRIRGEDGISYGGVPYYYWYGALPYNTRYDASTGKMVSTFTLPEYKAATLVMKMLYEEGILDKEFATNDGPQYFSKRNNKNMLLDVNTMDQVIPANQISTKGNPKDYPQAQTWETIVAPPLKSYPAELADPKYVGPYSNKPINQHGVYISSQCKNPDRAWRVIEALVSDELRELIFWGKEGSEYTVKDGKRIPIPEKINDTARTWSLQLSLISGFTDGQDAKKAIGEYTFGKEYSDLVYNAVDLIDSQARANGIEPFTFANDELSAESILKRAEMKQFITKTTIELIMNKITAEQFDKAVAEFQQKYGWMFDEQTKYVADNKDRLAEMGVNLK